MKKNIAITPVFFIFFVGINCSKTEKLSDSPSRKESQNSTAMIFDPNGGTQAFGKKLSTTIAHTPLQDILSKPQKYENKTVQTSGVVKRVCQAMGCWIEIENEKKQAIQIPMAGHEYVVPKNSSGAKATIEGKVTLQQLREDEKEHLAKEGAEVLDVGVQIEATGVVLEPFKTDKGPSETTKK